MNPNTFNLRDRKLFAEILLPAAEATAYGPPFDLGPNQGTFLVDCEAVLTLPAGAAVLMAVEHSDDGAVWSTLHGARPAAAGETRFRFPTDVKRHIRVAVTAGAGAELTGMVGTFRLLF